MLTSMQADLDEEQEKKIMNKGSTFPGQDQFCWTKVPDQDYRLKKNSV